MEKEINELAKNFLIQIRTGINPDDEYLENLIGDE